MARDLQPGDKILTKPRLMHFGEDIGDRLGTILSTEGYILVELDCYHSNPVKCFRYEVGRLGEGVTQPSDEEIEDFFDNLDLFTSP